MNVPFTQMMECIIVGFIRINLIKKKFKDPDLMVSDFVLPCYWLEIPSTVALQVPSILSDRHPEPVPSLKINPPQAAEYIKVSNGSWWNRNNLVHYVLNITIQIFEAAFPDAQALFLFDYAIAHWHTAHGPDALRASHMNMEPGAKQPLLSNGLFYELSEITLHSQQMTFNENDQLESVLGKMEM